MKLGLFPLIVTLQWISVFSKSSMLRGHQRQRQLADQCEDSLTATFLDSTSTTRDCIWLSGRDADIAALCSEGSDAYVACPDTCGACVDPCQDADDTVKLPMYTADPSQQIYVYNSTCSRLADRPRDWDNACAVAEISALCQDVCNSCDTSEISDGLSGGSTETSEGGTSTSSGSGSSSSSGNGATAETPSPTNEEDFCDDKHFEKFMVLGQKEKNCAWLASRLETPIVNVREFTGTESYADTTFGELLCVDGEDAYVICEETCGRCTDNCVDTDGVDIDEDTEGMQDCAWLRSNPRNYDRFCRNRRNFEYNTLASTYCKETCQTCS